MNIKSGTLYAGTSGLVIPIPKRSFPAEYKDYSRLKFYSTLFNSIEINSSFYKLPNASTLSKWSEDVSPSFGFTFKLWREISHAKQLLYNIEDLDNFLNAIAACGDTMSCILVQFPPSLTISAYSQLRSLLIDIKENSQNRNWKIAIEFRNKSWYIPETIELVNEFGACIAMHDHRSSASPFPSDQSPFYYLRFHGPDGAYRGSYADDHLHEYAQYIKEWSSDGKEVYIYFNNTMGNALENLFTLKSYIETQGSEPEYK